MRRPLSYRLAVQNLRSSYRLSVPYILSGILSFAMCYIVLALSTDPGLEGVYGGRSATSLLKVGSFIVAIGSFLFLFNINRYLIRQRGREFALYGILGMDKPNVMKVLFTETVLVFLIVVFAGLSSGIIFSKLFQLILLRMIHYGGNLTMRFSSPAFCMSALLFLAVYLVNFIYAGFKVAVSSPVRLLSSHQTGERQTKANPLITIAGVATLAGGYVLAQLVADVSEAVVFFFPAVILVILGTHCLFLSGSAVIMNLLKKNKKYYYQPHHFISLSGLMHRMKRNASGLATICILACMVIVTVSVTVSIYYGTNESIKSIYRKEINAYGATNSIETYDRIRDKTEEIAASYDGTDVSSVLYACYYFAADGNEFTLADYDNSVAYLNFLEQSAFNEITGKDISLGRNELLVFGGEASGIRDTIVLEGKEFHVIRDKDMPSFQNMILSSGSLEAVVVVPSFSELDFIENSEPERWLFETGFDMDPDDTQKVEDALNAFGELNMLEYTLWLMPVSRTMRLGEEFAEFGSMLFLGVFLGLLFVIMTVLIIYYKQISEGYEDVERFRAMENIGLGEDEVRRTISSQVLVTFFAPLAAALVHVLFAYNMVERIVAGFGTVDKYAYILSLAITSLVFAVIYVIVYAGTSRVYYHIVQQA